MHLIVNSCSQLAFRFLTVLAILVVLGGCATVKTTHNDFIPQSFIPPAPIQKYQGTINVQVSVPLYTTMKSYIPRMKISDWMDNKKLKVALENTIMQNGLFSQVSQSSADYVLDIWVENIHNGLQVFGQGFMFDMFSIWRLIRTADGAVLLCDEVKGHGASHGIGSRAYPPALSAAAREMIQNGLTMLVDQSPHLSALPKAELWSSTGPALPVGYAKWVDHVRQNWSKLEMGLTFEEVDRFIGPIKNSRAIIDQYTEGATEGYLTSIYRVVFINGKLSLWELLQR